MASHGPVSAAVVLCVAYAGLAVLNNISLKRRPSWDYTELTLFCWGKIITDYANWPTILGNGAGQQVQVLDVVILFARTCACSEGRSIRVRSSCLTPSGQTSQCLVRRVLRWWFLSAACRVVRGLQKVVSHDTARRDPCVYIVKLFCSKG